jgi:DNA-binding transcriptional ArsR family regulator
MNINEEFKTCECKNVHQEIVSGAKSTMPDEEVLYDLAELFKVFGDSTRIRILYALFASEMCVCDIANLLNMTDSAISHQLRVLKQARLVKFRKEGKTVFYSLDDDHVSQIFNCGLCHIQELNKK